MLNLGSYSKVKRFWMLEYFNMDYKNVNFLIMWISDRDRLAL